MLELGVIADDLTGGMMVASLLEREGVRCPLVPSVEALDNLSHDAEAVVVTLPLPTVALQPKAYVALLHFLSNQQQMPPMIIMRGNGDSILTFYSD